MLALAERDAAVAAAAAAAKAAAAPQGRARLRGCGAGWGGGGDDDGSLLGMLLLLAATGRTAAIRHCANEALRWGWVAGCGVPWDAAGDWTCQRCAV